jgi:hypothetical protein
MEQTTELYMDASVTSHQCYSEITGSAYHHGQLDGGEADSVTKFNLL